MAAVARAATWSDIALALAVVLLLGFAPAAWVAEQGEPRPNGRTVELDRAEPTPTGAQVQEMPAGLPEGVTAETPESLRKLATAALGSRGAEQLIRLLARPDGTLRDKAVGGRFGFGAPYPYRYPAMSRILEQSASAGWRENGAALGAALVLLASRDDVKYEFGETQGETRFPNAGPAAFAVLDRASSGGGCEVRLNLLLVVAADEQPRDGVVREAAERAMETCPDDPTPGWILGQFQSLRAQQADAGISGDAVPDNAAAEALATFESLIGQFPNSADVLAGAADVHVREGSRIAVSEPFTARHHFRTAVELYRRIIEGSSSAEIETGLARALIGLGEASLAADALRNADDTATPGFRLELLTKAEEAAHDFESAQRTARRLADLGADAYPRGSGLFAVPGFGASFDGDDLDIPAVSVGVDRFAPFRVLLQPFPGAGAGIVDDVSFIPAYREDLGFVGTMASCPEWGWRRDALLAGNADEALLQLPKDLAFMNVRPDEEGECGSTYWLERTTRALIRLEAGEQLELRPGLVNQLYERRQNMWRWAGDLPRSVDVIDEWLEETPPKAAMPMLRLGEVRFLQEKYDESAAAFGTAARRARQANWDDDLGVVQALLGRAAALIRAGRSTEGIEVLRRIEPTASRGVAYHDAEDTEWMREYAAVAYHTRALLADTERETGALAASLEDYEAAREMLPVLARPQSEVIGVTGHRPERLDGNQAVAELAAGQRVEARESILRALQVDPMNPAFLMTAGFIAERSGESDAAIDYNRQALESDPGAFPAANDLGVQLAREQRNEEAIAALRHAVYTEPSYALGWFNLGVVHASMGPHHILSSQGAFARAIELDPQFGDRKRELTIDAQIYRTGLDLSKPLPPKWSFAGLDRLAPSASVGLLAALLLGMALARSGGGGGQDFAGRWVATVSAGLDRVPFVNSLKAPVWALGLTVVLFMVTMVRQGWTEVWGLAAAGLAVAVMAVAAVRSRVLVARLLKHQVRQEGWPPGMVVGIAGTAAGAVWAPLPVIDGEKSPARIYAAAPLALGVVTGVLLLEAVLLNIPLTRSLAISGLIMAASTLLPVPPLDGARLEKAGLVAGAGLVGAASLILLGLG